MIFISFQFISFRSHTTPGLAYYKTFIFLLSISLFLSLSLSLSLSSFQVCYKKSVTTLRAYQAYYQH